MDLTGLVLEAAMWAKGRLKAKLEKNIDYFALADNIGFEQIMVGDIIYMDRARLPEKMLVTAFDEPNKLVRVQRAYQGTTAQEWPKGTPLKIMKFSGAAAETEMIYEDVLQIDGTTQEDVLTDSFFIYNWGETDTCLPGCYYMEFKLIKMAEEEDSESLSVQAITPSFTAPGLTKSDFGCGLGEGVEWVRRFPVDVEGFIVKIHDSPTSEN